MAPSLPPSRLPTRINGDALSPRSVSDPFTAAPSSSSTTASPVNRRSSFGSASTSITTISKRKDHFSTLPSIRSLRDKFQALASGTRRSAQVGKGGEGKGPKVLKGDEARKAVLKVSSPKAGGRGLKGFSGPAGAHGLAEATGMVRSASAPSIAPNPIGQLDEPLPVPLPPFARPPAGQRPSVDSLLAVHTCQSPSSTTNDASFVSIPAPPIPLPPYLSSSDCSTRPKTSDGLPPSSPLHQKPPILNRISADFARSPVDPPLSSLRAQQVRETESLLSTKRHSRILPGATLPSNFAEPGETVTSSPLVRSKSAGPRFASEKRKKHHSAQEALPPPPPPVPERASWQVAASLGRGPSPRFKDDLAFRRHSITPVSPVVTSLSSVALAPANDGRTEEQRGKTLGQLLGMGRRASLGQGQKRPSKPFPGGFEEVPFQPQPHHTPPHEDTLPFVPSPSRPIRPLSLSTQRQRSADYPDTPPHSARLPVPLPQRDSSLPPSSAFLVRDEYGNDDRPVSPRTLPTPNGPHRPSELPHSAGPAQLTFPRSSLEAPFSQPETQPLRRSKSASNLQDFSPLHRMTTTDRPFPPVISSPLAQLLASFGSRRPSTLDEEDDDIMGDPAHGRASAGGRILSSSPGGESAFPLAGHLDSSTFPRSPAVAVQAFAPTMPSPSSPLPSPSRTTPSRPQGLAAPSSRHSPTTPDSARTLTLGEMEVEIARMEKELARSGRPRTFFVPGPEDEDGKELTTDSPTRARTLDFPPSDPSAEVTSIQQNSSIVTPRTARRWSILEVEKAYERMRKMLGSSTSSSKPYAVSEAGTEREGDGDETVESVDVEKALEVALEEARGFTGAKDGGEDEEREVLKDEADGDVFGSPRSQTITPVAPHPTLFAKRASPVLHSDFDSKPLPDLSPSSPSHTPVSTRQLDSADSSATSSATEHAESQPPTSATATSRSPSVPSHSHSVDSSIPTGLSSPRSRRHSFTGPLPCDEPTPALETAPTTPLAANSGRRRKDSDASSTRGGGAQLRRLIPPSSDRLRHKSTAESLRSVEDTTSEDGGVASPVRGGNGRRSRLSSSGLLRSGAGREMQKWATGSAGEGTSTMSESGASERDRDAHAHTYVPAARSGRASIHRLSPMEGTPVRARSRAGSVSRELATSPLTTTASRRRDLTRSTASDSSSTWYPSTPDRVTARTRAFTDEAAPLALSNGGGRGSRRGRRASEDSAVMEGSDLMDKASVNIANIRGMDKLEIFFKYTAAKADLEKAELERDALLDALRETRMTLSDIRRQRDSLDTELKRERQLSRQIKKHLGDHPDRYSDKLDNLFDSCSTWELRAKQALEELDRTRDELDAVRRELVEGKEREELLERETVMMGARLAASEAARSDFGGSPAPLAGSSKIPTPASKIASPRLSGSPRLGGLPSPSTRRLSASTYSLRSSISSTHRRSESAPGSPTLTMPRIEPNSDARPHVSPSTPVTKQQPNGSSLPRDRARAVSKDSLASSSSELEPTGLGEIGSPLMGQTMAFGPKSSFGSNASPLKARSSAAPPTLIPRFGGQFSRLRLPLPSSSPPPPSPPSTEERLKNKMSTISSSMTIGSDEYDDYAERSFESISSATGAGDAAGLARLRDKDAAFLADLTAEIPPEVK
ncbi:hypothetical protein JCM1841_005420 [Sporobolomyces salmonicolor]